MLPRQNPDDDIISLSDAKCNIAGDSRGKPVWRYKIIIQTGMLRLKGSNGRTVFHSFEEAFACPQQSGYRFSSLRWYDSNAYSTLC